MTSMIEYINLLKCGLRDQHGLVPTGGTSQEPLFDNVADGEYPMTINGVVDAVRIEGGKFNCCNFEAKESDGTRA